MKTRTKHVVCWVEPGFDALDVSGFCQVLSETGSTWNWRAYRVELASRAGGMVMSSAQVAVSTVALDDCATPDVVVVAGAPSPLATDPPERWAGADIEWVGLRKGLLAIVSTGRFGGARVAASPRLQPRLLATEPSLRFVTEPFFCDGRLWSCASADTTLAALALVQRHVGGGARRAVETALGLTLAFPPMRVELTSTGPGSLPAPTPDDEEPSP